MKKWKEIGISPSQLITSENLPSALFTLSMNYVKGRPNPNFGTTFNLFTTFRLSIVQIHQIVTVDIEKSVLLAAESLCCDPPRHGDAA